MKRLLTSCLLLLAALFGAGWWSAVLADDKDAWATVKGRIVWGGETIPQRQPLDLKNNPDQKHCEQDGKILEEKWVINKKDKGIRYTFVWLEADPKSGKKKIPIHPALQEIKIKEVSVDQPVCMFIPHAQALREGQDVVVKNSSSVAHNFKWTGDPSLANSQGNILLPPKGSFKIKGLEASRFPVLVSCNIHPWMNGYLRVFNHPYYGVTNESGAFEMPKAPVGEYRLKIWHGSAGWLGGAAGKTGKAITIKAGHINDLGDISFPPPAQ